MTQLTKKIDLTLGQAVDILKKSNIVVLPSGNITIDLADGGWGATKNPFVRAEAIATGKAIVAGLANLSGIAEEHFKLTPSGLVVGVDQIAKDKKTGDVKSEVSLLGLLNRLAELGVFVEGPAAHNKSEDSKVINQEEAMSEIIRELEEGGFGVVGKDNPSHPYKGKLQKTWAGALPDVVANEAWVPATKETFLKDYTRPSHLFNKTDLTFELNAPDEVIVSSKLKVYANPESQEDPTVIRLNAAAESREDGNDNPTLQVLEVKVNGRTLSPSEYLRKGEELIIPGLPTDGEFEIETKSKINPEANKSNMGLYMSGKFATQCEPEGFRNITPYLDRPAVVSHFTTTIIAPKGKYPQLLSNPHSKPVVSETADGRDMVVWDDPRPKPAHLFALVAGDMDILSDTFTYPSGRKVELNFYCDKGDREKLHHAMQSLKDAMLWDYNDNGHEFVGEIFNTVAVNDFNFGAMENTGLNIFNASLLLADPKTATDDMYEHIQAVDGHEFFHDLTGNTIMPENWYQITLKEGLTVLRDAEFTADMNSRPIKRINDTIKMRSKQFPEDAGAMAHPIRPSSFVSINNFYTATVYEKGKEVIGMIMTLGGKDAFKEGMQIYKKRFSGKTATTEDFVQCMQDGLIAKNVDVDLTQFEETWYNQAGTPVLDFVDEYDPATQTYKLTIKQSVPTHPNNKPYHIPVRVGLLGADGKDLPLEIDGDPAQLTNGDVLNLREGEQTFVFKNVKEKPLPSLLRGWSAPVRVNYDYSRDDLMFLMSNDSDGFNRWDAAQSLGADVIKELVEAHQKGENRPVDPRLITAFKAVLENDSIDKVLAARTIALPDVDSVAGLYPDGQVDVDAIVAVRDHICETIGRELEPQLKKRFDENRSTETRKHSWNPVDAGERAIKNISLDYLVTGDAEKYLDLALVQARRDQNATDNTTALHLIADYADEATRAEEFQTFFDNNKQNPLIVNAWLTRQSTSTIPNVLEEVQKLVEIGKRERAAFDAKREANKDNPDFDPSKEIFMFNNRNANALRAVVGGFTRNTTAFHAKDGSGYKFVSDQIIEVAKFNESVAAGFTKTLANPHRFDPERQELIREQLLRIQKNVKSEQVQEIVENSLALLDAKQKESRGNGNWSERAEVMQQAAGTSR